MSRYGPTSAGLLVTFHTIIIAKITKAATIGKKHKITSSSVPLITVVERNLTVANSSREQFVFGSPPSGSPGWNQCQTAPGDLTKTSTFWNETKDLW